MDLYENMVLRFSEYIDDRYVTRKTFDELGEILIANALAFEKPQLALRIYHHIVKLLKIHDSITVFMEIDLEPVRIRVSFEDGTKFRFSFNGNVPNSRFQKFIITR